MIPLEQEDLLDKFMLERMPRDIWPLTTVLEALENATVIVEGMAVTAWEEQLRVYLELQGKNDAGDCALRPQLETLSTSRSYRPFGCHAW